MYYQDFLLELKVFWKNSKEQPTKYKKISYVNKSLCNTNYDELVELIKS
jgi:hypothetical protein